MHHDQNAPLGAEPQQDEPRFDLGVVWIGQDDGLLVAERRDGFGECDAMLRQIRRGLSRVPIEAQVSEPVG